MWIRVHPRYLSMDDSARGQIKPPMAFEDEHINLVNRHGYADRFLDEETTSWHTLLLAYILSSNGPS